MHVCACALVPNSCLRAKSFLTVKALELESTSRWTQRCRPWAASLSLYLISQQCNRMLQLECTWNMHCTLVLFMTMCTWHVSWWKCLIAAWELTHGCEAIHYCIDNVIKIISIMLKHCSKAVSWLCRCLKQADGCCAMEQQFHSGSCRRSCCLARHL